VSPLHKQGKITNTQRIDAALPTIRYALDHGAKVRKVPRNAHSHGHADIVRFMPPCGVDAHVAAECGADVTFGATGWSAEPRVLAEARGGLSAGTRHW
jgi:hypothetical protein